MSRVDLHVHSNASDGRYYPEEIICRAAELGIEVLSITDHDSVDGISRARRAARKYPLRFIPGVEISTDIPHGEVHVLGYFINHIDRRFRAELKKFRESREGRARKMVSRLASLGINIDWERVQELAGTGAIGRPHVARAMLEKGYIQTFEEAFDKYIGRDGPAYVEREKMTPEEAVRLIIQAHGLPVLAHPFTTGDPEGMVAELKKAGLVGIEAYYKENTPEQTTAMLDLAARYGLIATGGSDFHGIEDSRDAMLGSVDVPLEAATRLIALAEKMGCPLF